MKRGLITWDKSELPEAAFASRIAAVRKSLAERDLPALVIYTDIWKSNQGRHFTNFMPYWNRALIVVQREGAPVLLCALSPRVYPWIRSVTILDEIRASGNMAGKLIEMCGEKSWKRIGVLDLARLPGDQYIPLQGKIETLDVPSSEVWPAVDEWELAMHRRATRLARKVLAEEFPHAGGCVDHEFAGRLERAYRRAGAEDLVLLMTNGRTAPLPPNGSKIVLESSVMVALEYRGHWIKMARPHPASSAAAHLQSRFNNCVKDLGAALTTPVYVETLSGPFPYESCDRAEVGVGKVFALHIETQSNNRRLFYGDTACRRQAGAELL